MLKIFQRCDNNTELNNKLEKSKADICRVNVNNASPVIFSDKHTYLAQKKVQFSISIVLLKSFKREHS
jgi:hypothetical protein